MTTQQGVTVAVLVLIGTLPSFLALGDEVIWGLVASLTLWAVPVLGTFIPMSVARHENPLQAARPLVITYLVSTGIVLGLPLLLTAGPIPFDLMAQLTCIIVAGGAAYVCRGYPSQRAGWPFLLVGLTVGFVLVLMAGGLLLVFTAVPAAVLFAWAVNRISGVLTVLWPEHA